MIREGDDVLVTEQADAAPGVSSSPAAASTPARGRSGRCTASASRRPAGASGCSGRIGAFQRYAYMPEYDLWARKVCHVYLARPVLRHGPPSEPGHRAIWMPIATAVELLAIEGDRAFLRRAARA